MKPQNQGQSSQNLACRNLLVKSSPTMMKMCPPATLRNWKFHKSLLAVGNTNGFVQIFDLNSGKLYRELKVHSHPVVGIEWIGLNAFISYANSLETRNHQINDDVIWELCITELDTGRTVQLKTGHSADSSLILSVKASHLRQYFIIIYKSNPFEIWDLDSLSLLRRVPKKFSSIVAAEWSPLYSKKVDTSKINSTTATTNEEANNQAYHTKDNQETTTSTTTSSNAPLKENFVVINKQGELFHFSIAGSLVKEISRIPPESSIDKPVTAIAWKSDHIVLGQNNGNINVWDLEKKESRTMCTMRGSIKRIRFAPGRGNMKILLLFDDGVDIWDIKKLRLISSLSDARSDPRFTDVIDAEWAASDRPVILSSDGRAVVTDVEMKRISTNGNRSTTTTGNNEAGTIPYRVGLRSNTNTNSSSSSNEPCYLQ